ncbi:sugar ABC transporter ATP-binding protein [Microbacterium sp. ABRD28]|uniref:sugar ABC transporter ATP-binding protein n=1 Tax=Microbacterium sp. ABRD28 TaxID=2268461 RepID=UPI000F5523B7|nr:sugar ABC transporter ATP-binding protein [Microbacterium sp. ABRD28]AZC13225.1 sugar ABC transporter ATP-binding protein [Microbacterium sp. ABRD28]
MTRPSSAAALEIRGVRKVYPGVTALDAVDLTVAAGSVHGLVGENGAGKSTLMKVVAGAIAPDEGRVRVDTVAVRPDVHAAADAGVAMIYQELTIVPGLTAADNVFLGAPPRRGPVLDRRGARRRFADLCMRLGVEIDASARAGDLSTSQQQLLEIMRALARDRRLVIMDEPTASLGPADIARLHGVIRDLRGKGVTVIYVSHDLDAVLDVCDDVSVMRAGRVVETRGSAAWTADALVAAMIGAVDLDAADAPARPPGQVALRVEGLRAPGVDLPHLELRAGEIVGIAGLVGSGRSRLLRTLAGADRARTGTLEVAGRAVRWPSTPRRAQRLGITLAPEDRKVQGLVLERPSSWNVALGAFRRAAAGGIVTRRGLLRWSRRFTARVALPEQRLAVPVGTLSGGNQQKVLLARQISRSPRLLLLDEPTRGIDVGAKAQVFRMLRTLADEGMAVAWVSSELEEIARHSDRILVLSQGRAVAELSAGAAVHDILTHAFTGAQRKAAA